MENIEKENKEKYATFREDLSLLIEAGFVAVKQLDETSAQRIFNAAQVIAPDSTAPKLGFGFIALSKMECEEAAKIYGEIIEIEPDNELARTFFGICLLFTKGKDKEGSAIIEKIKESSQDPNIINLANQAMETYELKFAKKKAMPFGN